MFCGYSGQMKKAGMAATISYTFSNGTSRYCSSAFKKPPISIRPYKASVYTPIAAYFCQLPKPCSFSCTTFYILKPDHLLVISDTPFHIFGFSFKALYIQKSLSTFYQNVHTCTRFGLLVICVFILRQRK